MILSTHAEHTNTLGVPYRVTVSRDARDRPRVVVSPMRELTPNEIDAPNRKKYLTVRVRELVPRMIVRDPETDPPLTYRWREDVNTHGFTSLLDNSPKPPAHMRNVQHRHTFTL